MEFTLREAADTDRDEIFRLYRNSMKEYIESIWGWDDDWQRNDFDTKWGLLSTRVIELDSKFIGYLQTEEKDDSLYISMMILSPEQRSRGIGSRILSDLLARSSRDGKKLMLRVFKLNRRAIAFYRRLDLKTVAEEADWLVMER
jgi:ribosomal protein S18 acetylase RimI-like enzyme